MGGGGEESKLSTHPSTHPHPHPQAGRALKKARRAAAPPAWRPSRPADAGPRPCPSGRVPPLTELTAVAVAHHMDAVASLAGLPDAALAKLAAAAAARRSLDARAAAVLTAGRPADVDLPDASGLDAATMASLLVSVATGGGLERLSLGFCGRGLGDAAARSLARCGPHARLTRVSLSGAFRLTDDGLAALLASTPALTLLALPSACAIGGGAIARLPVLTPGLTSLDVTHCRGVDANALLSALALPAASSPGLPRLARLALDGLPAVTDDLLATLAPRLCSLAHLSVSACGGVGDEGLTALAAARGSALTFLAADGAALTDAGLAAIVDAARGLRHLSLATCGGLTDTGVAAAVSRLGGGLTSLSVARVPAVAGRTLTALTRSCTALADLDISWCRRVPEASVGALADSVRSLTRVAAYGCSQIGAAVVNGHTNDGLGFVGAVAEVEGVLDQAVAKIVVPE